MRCRNTEEQVRAFDSIGQGPLLPGAVGHFGQFRLDGIEAFHTGVEDARTVDHSDVFSTGPDQEAADGSAGSTGTVDDDTSRLEVFFDEAQGSDDAS